MDPIDIEARRSGVKATLRVSGEVDVTSSPRLEQEISDLLEAGVRDLTVDLAGVSFMESTGLRILLAAGAKLDGTLTLRSPSDVVQRLLEVSGLTNRFRIA